MTHFGARPQENTSRDGFHDQPWSEQALCADSEPEAFFPEQGGSTEAAKAVCGRCEVRAQCRSWAIATGQPFGVWGGLTEAERRVERRALRHSGGTAIGAVEAVADPPAVPRAVSRGAYVSGTGHIALPMATDTGIRPTHKPQKPKPTGLDWSQHRAPDAPVVEARPEMLRCRWCRTLQPGLVDDVCPSCREEAEQQFTVPTPVPRPPVGRHVPTEPDSGLDVAVQNPSPVARFTPSSAVSERGAAKTCSTCSKTKSLADFYVANGTHGVASYCKKCQNSRPKKVTATRINRQRARNRAVADLVAMHPDEFETLMAIRMAEAQEEAEQLATTPQAAEHYKREPVRLRPGKRMAGEQAGDRIDVARCPHCAKHHDRGHVCPECGAAPELTPPAAAKASSSTHRGVAS